MLPGATWFNIDRQTFGKEKIQINKEVKMPIWLIPVLSLVPSLVQAIESLFKPKTGASKLNAVINLAEQALTLSGTIDPKNIGDAERALFVDISNAVVKYNNAKGIFVKSA